MNTLEKAIDQTDPVILDFMQQIQDHEAKKEKVNATGLPALKRLIEIAKGDTGQCTTVRNLLLGLYNGHAFPFDLTRLRGLDKNIFDDCMAVITLDARVTYREIHEYVENGAYLFECFAFQERNAQ